MFLWQLWCALAAFLVPGPMCATWADIMTHLPPITYERVCVVVCTIFAIAQLVRVSIAPIRTLASYLLGFCSLFVDTLFVRPAKWVYLNHRSRRLIARKLRHAVATDEIELTGKLRYDYQGPYLEVNTARGMAKVRVSSADMFPLVHSPAPAAKYGEEAEMPRSMVLPQALPKYVVELLSCGRVVGAGFRTSVGKQDVILTASHVIRGLMQSGSEFVLRANGNEVVVDDEMKKLMIWAVDAPGLDVTGFTLPPRALSHLAITKGKMARTPVQTAIRSHGFYKDDYVMCTGTITKTLGSLMFKHNATTVPGFSGSPITTPTGAIVGMHLKGFSMHNEGVSLDLFVAQGRQESDFVLQAYHNDLDQDEYEDLLEDQTDAVGVAAWKHECRFRTADQEFEVTVIGAGNRYDTKRTLADADKMRTYVPLTMASWADDEDSELEELHFESDFRGLPKTSGAPSATTTGQRVNAMRQVTASISKLSDVTATLQAELNASRVHQQKTASPFPSSMSSTGPDATPQPSENPSASTQKCTDEPTPASHPAQTKQPPAPKKSSRKLSKQARVLLPRVQGLYVPECRELYGKTLSSLTSDLDVQKEVTSELELRMQQARSERERQKLERK